MTEKQLKNYLPLVMEVKHLEELRAARRRDVLELRRRGLIGTKDNPFAASDRIYSSLLTQHRRKIQRVEKAIELLPDSVGRDVLRLLYLEGLTAQEVGDALAYSVENVYYHRKRALDLLGPQRGRRQTGRLSFFFNSTF